MKKHLTIFLVITLFFAFKTFSQTQYKINWEKFISVNDLQEQIVQLGKDNQETEDNQELIEISKQFQEAADNLNKQWEEKYFNLVANLNTANEEYARYEQLRVNIKYLKDAQEQINNNIKSVQDIYKNRLKAVATGYLILAKVKTSGTEAKSQKARKLIDLTKEYLAENYSPFTIYSETEVKNYKLVKDLIEAVEAGRVESFESDHLWFVTKDDYLYLLQKYRIYPEFPEKENIKNNKSITAPQTYKTVEFYKITTESDSNLPSYWLNTPDILQQITLKIKEIKQFNKEESQKLSTINIEYQQAVIYELIKKKEKIATELKNKEEELNTLTQNNTKDFTANLNKAEEELNTHVKSREMLVFTILSELEQTGRSLEEQFQELIKQSYDDLIKRAEILKSYKFYLVINHKLVSYKAQEFYDKVTPIYFSMPLRRKTYREEEGGVNRLGVLLALKVKFESTGKLPTISENPPLTKGDNGGFEDMILIPAGEFIMGSNDGSDDEKPVHKVYLDTYYIDKYEVTNAKYKECVTAGKCKLPSDTKYYNNSIYANHPVVYVDWYSADSYCKWAGKQLPTEAQWEKAARGTQGYTYPWGNDWDCKKSCNSVSPCSQNITCEVGSYSAGASPYGVQDMAGNVWEWVSDWYDSNYYKNSPYKNPTGAGSGSYKVLRGGSWDDFNAVSLRSANRNLYYPLNLWNSIGFRCALIKD